jgi:hypothetical protein
MTIVEFDRKHFAITDRPAEAPTYEFTFAELRVGDVVNNRWTIERVTRGEAVVAALGSSPSGARHALSGEPAKRVRHAIAR